MRCFDLEGLRQSLNPLLCDCLTASPFSHCTLSVPAHLVVLEQLERRYVLASATHCAGNGNLASADDTHGQDTHRQCDKGHNDLPGMASTEATILSIVDAELGSNCPDAAGLLIP